jgi:hypothetical protein
MKHLRWESSWVGIAEKYLVIRLSEVKIINGFDFLTLITTLRKKKRCQTFKERGVLLAPPFIIAASLNSPRHSKPSFNRSKHFKEQDENPNQRFPGILIALSDD